MCQRLSPHHQVANPESADWTTPGTPAPRPAPGAFGPAGWLLGGAVLTLAALTLLQPTFTSADLASLRWAAAHPRDWLDAPLAAHTTPAFLFALSALGSAQLPFGAPLGFGPLRLILSWLPAMLTCLGAGLLAARWSGRRAGLWTFALLGTSPFLIAQALTLNGVSLAQLTLLAFFASFVVFMLIDALRAWPPAICVASLAIAGPWFCPAFGLLALTLVTLSVATFPVTRSLRRRMLKRLTLLVVVIAVSVAWHWVVSRGDWLAPGVRPPGDTPALDSLIRAAQPLWLSGAAATRPADTALPGLILLLLGGCAAALAPHWLLPPDCLSLPSPSEFAFGTLARGGVLLLPLMAVSVVFGASMAAIAFVALAALPLVVLQLVRLLAAAPRAVGAAVFGLVLCLNLFGLLQLVALRAGGGPLVQCLSQLPAIDRPFPGDTLRFTDPSLAGRFDRLGPFRVAGPAESPADAPDARPIWLIAPRAAHQLPLPLADRIHRRLAAAAPPSLAVSVPPHCDHWDSIYIIPASGAGALEQSFADGSARLAEARTPPPGGQILLPDDIAFRRGTGWNELELDSQLNPYRWTHGEHQALAWRGPERPGKYRLTVHAWRPHPFPTPRIIVQSLAPGADQWQSHPVESTGLVDISMPVRLTRPHGILRLELRVPCWQPMHYLPQSADPRLLGLEISSITLTPLDPPQPTISILTSATPGSRPSSPPAP